MPLAGTDSSLMLRMTAKDCAGPQCSKRPNDPRMMVATARTGPAGASKVKTLAEAAALVDDGDHLGLSGFAIARNAVAFSHELIRQGKRELTLSGCVVGLDADLLVGAGLVRRLIYGGGSLDRFGPIQCVNRAYERGNLVAEYYTSLAVCFRYLAGALGLPFMPIKSLLESDVLEVLERETAPDAVRETSCPFTGERLAARQVIVIAEELVPTEVIRQQPELTTIPGFRVSAVVPLPYGAHPTSLYRCYDYDAEHLKLYASQSRTEEGIAEYLREFVLEPKDHFEYLERIGGIARLAPLKADPILGY